MGALQAEVHTSTKISAYGDPALPTEVEALLEAVGALVACSTATRVVLKPNWVHDTNPLGHDSTSLVTQTQVIEAVASAVARRLSPGAALLVADAPVQSCNFGRLLKVNAVDAAVARLERAFPHVHFAVADWRLVRATSRWSWRATERVDQWNPAVHELVDVGAKSFLEPVSDRSDRFRVTGYPPTATRARHQPGVHQYLVAKAALDADVIINLPKLKTHMKAGITCALKNLVGINGHKEFLPHHVTGSPLQGGDSHASESALREGFERYYDFHFERLARLPRPLISVLSRALTVADRMTSSIDPSNFGSWPGNDTVWRMTLDLNHLLYFWAIRRPRAVFTLVDAVTVGVGDGPLRPRPEHLGVLLAGQNPATVDACGARLLGFDPRQLPTLRHALEDPASEFRTDEPPPSSALPRIVATRPANWERLSDAPGP